MTTIILSAALLLVAQPAAGRHAKLREMKALLDEDPAAAREKFFLNSFEDAGGRVIDMLEQLSGNVDAALAYLDKNAAGHGPRAVLP